MEANIVYRYIECNRTESDEHFKKFRHYDEVKNYIDTLSLGSWREDALNDGLDDNSLGYSLSDQNTPDVHVYRIKDIKDAINTSILLDFPQKEEYYRLLSDTSEEFDADVDFLEICENVGECDIY